MKKKGYLGDIYPDKADLWLLNVILFTLAAVVSAFAELGLELAQYGGISAFELEELLFAYGSVLLGVSLTSLIELGILFIAILMFVLCLPRLGESNPVLRCAIGMWERATFCLCFIGMVASAAMCVIFFLGYYSVIDHSFIFYASITVALAYLLLSFAALAMLCRPYVQAVGMAWVLFAQLSASVILVVFIASILIGFDVV